MSVWYVPAVLAAVCMAGHYLMLRAAAGRVGDALGALCVEGTAAAGILAYLLLRSGAEAPPTTAGILWACGSGLFISFVTTLSFMALRIGGPVTATGPMVFAGGIALAALFAPLLFDEAFTARRALGVGLGLASLVVLATERA
ncbi:hypothetical protein SOCEGT47_061330 [Sorangium cellulosum]|uniref:EamA domain-containing protein n=1 Tax=Sorangium cellulosum TaxID=56 RepID=A0A4P2Q7V4_SORCE|nr:hypothetical protein [Sorangium cellulosum]AUX25585.1 hypothetical protein SOCEGT47_061330 [Sorangium cellulosum]